ncbi:hypothetical protein BS333_13785 [Vibrio azureus]|uniref:DUF1566 domain-containing protein n=1 Tax=Vibrio azureus NBRC 104587 TaxID=1219077 RepID=U3ABG9_9VIBR|nr:DUF1566 domain-containing protein [Vibrio azureus]AUI87489.1 hypothetical protein BS333_13785 [Vibrio azureus]GAD77271.1 hypothetical protein VAZ01S_069_00190 [Vibrio azureus NBRC 104587]
MYNKTNQSFNLYRLSSQVVTIVLISSLFGCQDSSEPSSNESHNRPTTDHAAPPQAISTRSGFITVQPSTQEYIDISNYVSYENDVDIDSIEVEVTNQNIGQESVYQSGYCGTPTPELNGDRLGFYVQLDNHNLCTYRYKVTGRKTSNNEEVESQFAKINLFATVESDARLPTISKHILLTNNPNSQAVVNINLVDELSELNISEWDLSEDIILLGDGEIKTSEKTISYYGKTAGYVRIFYTLFNSKQSTEAKLGQIDITIGKEHTNGIIISDIEEFRYEVDSQPTLIVDIRNLIKLEYDIDYQLINVYSIDGSVSLNDEQRKNLNNKEFTFNWNKYSPKNTDVSFVLSDNEGNFKAGILRLVGINQDLTNAYLCNGRLPDKACIDIADIGNETLFTNSPSVNFLDNISSELIETNSTANGVLGQNYGNFYRFSHSKALALCDIYNTITLGGRTNWRLATLNELDKLFNTFGNMFNKRGWPTSYNYWSTTQTVKPTKPDQYKNMNLYFGYEFSYEPDFELFASCISERQL